MPLDRNRFIALQQPGMHCDLYLVHSMILDEIDINRGVISALQTGCPTKENDPYVHSAIQTKIQELTWANEGLRSLMEKVFERIDAHYIAQNDASGKESSELHSDSPTKVSVTEMLCSTAG